MSRYAHAIQFDGAGSKAKRKPFALDYASWHAHLAWHACLTGGNRRAA
jgi:hypothetical protein